jgi:hypothetical protein
MWALIDENLYTILSEILFFKIPATFIINCCIDDMNQEDIWSSSSINLNGVIGLVTDTINSWIQICDSLTRLFWTNCEQHTWFVLTVFCLKF